MESNTTTKEAARSWLDFHRAPQHDVGPLSHRPPGLPVLDVSATTTPEQRAAAEALRLLETERTKATL